MWLIIKSAKIGMWANYHRISNYFFSTNQPKPIPEGMGNSGMGNS
jgi:hypothetical protein